MSAGSHVTGEALLPVRVEPVAGEAIDSWLEATASMWRSWPWCDALRWGEIRPQRLGVNHPTVPPIERCGFRCAVPGEYARRGGHCLSVHESGRGGNKASSDGSSTSER